MKSLLLTAATGSLVAFATPAQAADITPIPDDSPVIETVPLLHTEKTYKVFTGDPPRHAKAYGRRNRDRYDDEDYYDRRESEIYDRQGRYREPRRLSRNDRIWRGQDGRYYCKRDNGTTGLIIGAGLGALAGRAIDTRGDRTVGTLLGGALGAVIGREIDRGELRCH